MEAHYLLSLFVCAYSAVGHPVSRFSVSSDRLLDLSHSFDENTVYWPTIPENSTFHLKTLHELINSTDGTAYRDKFFQGSEHGGTHMDAPSHFWKNGSSVEKISADKLMGPAVVIDVKEKAATNPVYQVTIQDVVDWEEQHGRIPEGAFVFMNSGWDTFWPDKQTIFNFDNTSGTETYHFPAFHPNATDFLVYQRSIKGLGVDTPSTDYGQAKVLGTHIILAKNDLVGFENVRNLGKLTPAGAHVIAIPMKIVDGSGAPLGLLGVNP
ncbi:hypothetical protein RvY_15497 [Ramazzottius varieornatus]|uniref:Cyclase n=1 Tax=Ramazzottius varieornatus TaxID=947166 RepID=A0A1D1W345_RAMVA|nr:hypothetical protein RvY_15497 [Ramazzottius varieornatus]